MATGIINNDNKNSQNLKYQKGNRIHKIYVLEEGNVKHNDYIQVGTWDKIQYKGMIVGKQNNTESILFFILQPYYFDINDLEVKKLERSEENNFGEIDISKVGTLELTFDDYIKIIS